MFQKPHEFPLTSDFLETDHIRLLFLKEGLQLENVRVPFDVVGADGQLGLRRDVLGLILEAGADMWWAEGASQPVSKVAPPLCLPRGASVTVAAFPERARGAETQLIEFTSHCSVFAPENRPRLLNTSCCVCRFGNQITLDARLLKYDTSCIF